MIDSLALVPAASLLGAPVARATEPGFDCSKAANDVEQRICKEITRP